MKRDEFLRRVMRRAGAHDVAEADRDARAVLGTLAEGISRDEAHDLASQLPMDLRNYMGERIGHAGPVQQMDMPAFVGRVQGELRLDQPWEAERVTRGVFAVLREAISPPEIEEVSEEFVGDLREVIRHD